MIKNYTAKTTLGILLFSIFLTGCQDNNKEKDQWPGSYSISKIIVEGTEIPNHMIELILNEDSSYQSNGLDEIYSELKDGGRWVVSEKILSLNEEIEEKEIFLFLDSYPFKVESQQKDSLILSCNSETTNFIIHLKKMNL